jgi:hypothetical protein
MDVAKPIGEGDRVFHRDDCIEGKALRVRPGEVQVWWEDDDVSWIQVDRLERLEWLR